LVLFGAAWWLVFRLKKQSAPMPHRNEIGVCLLVVLVLTLFISSHSLWRGGWTLGPRYIVAFVPFATLIIAAIAQQTSLRWPGWTTAILGGFVGASVFITISCSMVSQGFPFEYENPFVEAAIPLLRDGYVAQNLGNILGLSGFASALPFVLLMGVLLCLGLYTSMDGNHASRFTATAYGLSLAIILVVGLSTWTYPWNSGKAQKDRWLRQVWQPPEQSQEMRQRTSLEEKVKQREKLSPEEWMELGNLRALDGRSASAMQAYRRGRQP